MKKHSPRQAYIMSEELITSDIPEWIKTLREKLYKEDRHPNQDEYIVIVNPESKYSSFCEAFVNPLHLKSTYTGEPLFSFLDKGMFAMSVEEFTKYSTSLLSQKYNMENTEEITEARYYDLLECLPPENWVGKTFRMMEYQTSNYTTHCTKVGGKYFSCILPNTTKYEDWIKYIRENKLQVA